MQQQQQRQQRHKAGHGRTWAALAGMAVLAVTLVACGGGGGGDAAGTGGGGAGTSPSVPVSASGLLPAAPQKGAVLYADPTLLRPLRAGAVWTYNGTHSSQSQTGTTAFTDVVTQTAASTGVTETASNLFNGGAGNTANVYAAGGRIINVSTIQFSVNGPLQPLTDTELSSPVQQNDQSTVLDQHITDSGLDADGDGKQDVLDVALYRLVVGNEQVEIPNHAALTAVRVDQVLLVRATFSSTGKQSSVVKSVQSTWYAAGIGVVRQRVTTPTTSGVDDVDDEVLLSWDGVTEGLGAQFYAHAPVVSGLSGSATFLSGRVVDALPLGDHGVAQVVDSGANKFRFALVDLHGAVTVADTDVSMESAGGGIWNMLPAGDGFVEVSLPNLNGWITVHRFDSQAKHLNDAAGNSFTLVPPVPGKFPMYATGVRMASDGSGIWFLWERTDHDARNVPFAEMVLSKYSYAGQRISEVMLDPQGAAIDISAAGGQVIATWLNGTQVRYTVLSSDQAVPVVRQLDSSVQGQLVMPLALGSTDQFALYWWRNTTPVSMLGVRLDATLAPQLALGTADLGSDSLVLNLGGNIEQAGTGASGAAGGSMVFSGRVNAPLTPQSVSSSYFVVSDYPASALPFSQQVPRITRFDAGVTSAYNYNNVRQMIFPDRIILLMGSNNDGVASAVVWRR